MALANDRLRLKVGIQHDNFSMSPRVCTRRAPSVGMLGREQGGHNVDILAAFTYIYSTTMKKALGGWFASYDLSNHCMDLEKLGSFCT